MQGWLTLEDAAERAGLDRATLRHYARPGGREPHLPTERIGNMRLVKETDFDAWRKKYNQLPKRGRRK